MAPRKIKVRPGKQQSKFSFYFSLIFIFIGIFVAIPIFGLFGILWTAAACWICYHHYVNGFTDEGIPSYEINIQEDEQSSDSIESRLKKLENLYQSGLITREEYDHKRQNIINEI